MGVSDVRRVAFIGFAGVGRLVLYATVTSADAHRSSQDPAAAAVPVQS
jgi:hypothetical protein